MPCPIHNIKLKVGGIPKFSMYRIIPQVEDGRGEKFKKAYTRNPFFRVFYAPVYFWEVITNISGIEPKVFNVNIILYFVGFV